VKRLASKIAIAATLVVALPAAHAATLVFGSLVSGTGGPTPVSFATLTAAPSGPDLDLVVSAYGLAAFGSGASLASIIFAVPDGSSPGTCCTDVVGAVPVALLAGPPPPPGSQSGQFNFTGSGSGLTNGESVSWTWSAPVIVPGPAAFFAEVQGVTITGADGTLFYAPVTTVPEPQTYVLMLAGLGVLGFLARRRV
jgi:hypothetical protein